MKTNYRGPMVIHAAAKKMRNEDARLIFRLREMGAFNDDYLDIPYGKIVAITNLSGCYEMVNRPDEVIPDSPRRTEINIAEISEVERAVGFWREGRFALDCQDTIAIPPIPILGQQGWWSIRDLPTIEALYRAAPNFPWQ